MPVVYIVFGRTDVAVAVEVECDSWLVADSDDSSVVVVWGCLDAAMLSTPEYWSSEDVCRVD